MSANRLDDTKKLYIRNKIVAGALKYKQFLMEKDFYIICKDEISYCVHFYANDFKHLTGIDSPLSDNSFFDNCLKGLLTISNIDENQTYNWRTLRGKADRVEKIDEIIYGNSDNSLFMINLHTNTATFPVAIRNSDLDTCIGFTTLDNKARTLRKYSNSSNADEQKEIGAILAKSKTSTLYDELVYRNNTFFLPKDSDKLDMITKILKSSFSEPTPADEAAAAKIE